MPKKRPLKPIQGENLKWLLKKQPRLRAALKKFGLKLTSSGQLLTVPKNGCEPPAWKGGKLPPDSLIVKRRK
jgi:hypothetical protein